MNYFGTDLSSAGHFFFKLNGDRLDRGEFNFKDLPFDPYVGQKLKNGEVCFMNVGNYFTALVIGGSCTDSRGGCVSTFFVKEKITYSEMKERILSFPIAKKIIEKMPFVVEWPE